MFHLSNRNAMKMNANKVQPLQRIETCRRLTTHQPKRVREHAIRYVLQLDNTKIVKGRSVEFNLRIEF